MNKSEKRIFRNRQKRLKQRQKEQLREEKLSIKKQKKELKALKRKHNRKHQSVSLWERLVSIFASKNLHQQSHHKRPPGIVKRIVLSFRERKSFIRNKKEARDKQKSLFKLRSRQLRKEKKHRKDERKMMRQKTRPMRRKIREARIKQFQSQLKRFFRQPIKVKKLKEEERILRRHIKEDIRQQRREALQNIPENISNSLIARWRIRREKFNFFMMNLNTSLSGRYALKENREIRNAMLKTLLNSLAQYVLAFLIVYYVSKVVTIWIASIYSIPAVLYSYRIFWPLYTYSSLYSRQALILIFATGPLFSLLTAIIVYRVFNVLRFRNLNIKLLLLWSFFHGINLFFGAYISGVITRTGFVYATEWIFYSQVFDVEEIIFVIISIITLLVVGFYLARKFILSAGMLELVNPKVRLFYMLATVLLPWLFGSGILYLINYPNNPPELLLIYAASVLMVIPAMTNYNSLGNRAIKLVFNKQGVRIAWLYILACLVLLLVVRIIIYNGVSFR